jgi:tetratricopeptide (TPR) repeat protein
VAPRRHLELGETSSGQVTGTPAYMAPEQLTGRQIGRRADVFSFSVSLWEALFGGRPFPGKSIREIFDAMHRPAQPPPGARRVPRRLVHALRRGLALDPRDRWPDMPALLRELAAIRTRRKRLAHAVAAAGLVGLGIAAALAVARPEPPIDRCARALTALDAAYNPALDAQIGQVLARSPELASAVRGRLAATAEAWRQTHSATCRADRDVIQDARTTACLDARRLELAGSVEDVIANGAAGAAFAGRLSELPASPAACGSPAPGLLFARVPADRALRRQVTALRAELADADDARDHGDFPHALAEAARVRTAARALWPPLYAEAELAMGKIQRQGGDSMLALTTLRDAAVAAERAHHDDVAANAWLQLALASAFDQGDAARALEYVNYAEAAADRVGRPRTVMARLGYVKGAALVAADRAEEGERALLDAVALARTTSADDLARALHSLGYFYEAQGRYAEAVGAYRQAIEQLPRSPSGQVIGSPAFFEQLAVNLAHTGQLEAAELEARHAIEIAERTLPETQFERANAHVQLALILQDAGRLDEALAEITGAIAAVARIQGTRSARYGAVLGIQGDILADLGRHAEAEPLLARSCEITAFSTGDDAASYATCEVTHGAVLAALHRDAEAVAMLDGAIATLTRAYGASHPQLADAMLRRGAAHALLGHHRAALADFERVVAIFETRELEPGHLAQARWQLGKELWAAEPQRARTEILEALRLFETATGPWIKQRGEAAAWLANHDQARRRSS